MEIIEVDALIYDKTINAISLFSQASFAVLNQHKVDKLYFLLFKDSKVRLGIILGLRHNELLSPFSAPYGGFSFVEADCKAKIIDDAISVFTEWIQQKKVVKVKLSLPPMHYNHPFQTRLINGLRNNFYTIAEIDVNHHFQVPVGNFDDVYIKMLQRNARKNLNNALKEPLELIHLPEQEAHRAYQVIAINRSAKQKPLRMSLEQVLEVSVITKVDFFVVTHQKQDVASAIVFHVNKYSVQVVYWGDNPDFYELRSMNYLTYQLFKHYAQIGIQTLDIGISTENSVPNYGLCEFKESIGCDVSLKYTMVKEFLL